MIHERLLRGEIRTRALVQEQEAHSNQATVHTELRRSGLCDCLPSTSQFQWEPVPS